MPNTSQTTPNSNTASRSNTKTATDLSMAVFYRNGSVLPLLAGGRCQARSGERRQERRDGGPIGVGRLVVDEVSCPRNPQIAGPATCFVHLQHLARRSDRVRSLDQQRGHANRAPGCPVISRPPLGRDRDPPLDVAVQPPAGRRAVERIEEVLTRDRPELVEHLLRGAEFDGQRMQPRLPRAGGAAPEVRRHVLDDERADELRSLRGQAPAVQTTHRVADHDDRAANRGDRVSEVGDEPLGADRVWIGDVSAAVPRSVVGVNPAQFRQPRQLPPPRAAATHQAVDHHQGPAAAAAVGQQIAAHHHIFAAAGPAPGADRRTVA